MKKLILILVIVLPFLASAQDYRVIDWKTDVLNVQTINTDTFKFETEIKDYNDPGAITREIGNYFIDFVARCFKIIDSDATTITVVDLEHINMAPQSNQIGRVYQSVVDSDSLFESIGGVDISVLDQMSIYRDVARNNEIICRLLKELYLKDASYRQKTDHDSLSALDEKSYNSLTDKPTSLPASDVYPWAKAATKPTYTKSEVGLSNVDNTSDANKPISTATQTALNNLVPYTGALRDLDMGANSISTDTVKIDGTPLLLNTFKQGNLGGAGNIFYSTGASSQPASGSLAQLGIVPYSGATQSVDLGAYGLTASFVSGVKNAINSVNNNLGAPTVEEMAAIHGQFNNKLRFIPAFAQEESYDGVTWVTSSRASPSMLADIMIGEGQTGYIKAIPTTVGGDGYYRLTWDAIQTGYVYLNALYIYNCTNGLSVNIKIEEYDPVKGWVVVTSGVTQNWPGHCYIPHSCIPFANTDGLSYHKSKVRVSFSIINATNTNGFDIYAIEWLGGYPAGSRNVESYDRYRNVYFPSGISGNTLNSTIPTGTPPLVVASSTKVDNLNVSFLEGHPASYFETANVNIQRHITNDNDTIIDNEIQDLSRSGNTLSLSGDGTTVDLSDLVNPDLSGYATTTQLADQLSQTITNGVTTKAPSEDAVYDALAGKASVSGTDNYIMKKTGANTLGNSILIENNRKVGIDIIDPIAKLHVVESTFLGSTQGAYQIITSEQGNAGNRFRNNKWLLRNLAGNSWYTAIWHDGISIDNTYNIPRNNTRTWWERDPWNNIQSWGTNNTTYFTLNGENAGFGTTTPAVRIHSQSTATQARLGYDANKYTDLTTTSAGTFKISPSGGFTNFSGGITATAFSTFSGQVLMTGDDVNFGASTILRKNGLDIFTAPITMGACGSAGQVLTSTGINSAPTWTTPATGSGSGITSIGIQVPTGLTVTPTSLTSNGTFTFGLQSGYSIPTTTKQTQWDLAYYYRIQNVTGSNPLTLEMSGTTLTGYLNNTLSMFGTTTRSTGYLYWNGSSFSYQAATTTYTLPTASSSTLGGVKVNGNGIDIDAGGTLWQNDSKLTTRTPEVSDYIAFYDNSATAQGKMTLSTLGSLIGGSGGGMVYPGAGIPVSTGSAWGTSKTAPSGAIVGTTDSQALTNKSVNGVTLSTIEGPTRFLRGDGTYQRLNIVQTLTSASSITMDIWNGSKAVLALATNSTITITNVPDGGEGSIEVTSSGAYTLAIAGSTGYTTTQKMGTVSAIASSAHTTVFYWRSGSNLYYGFLLNN